MKAARMHKTGGPGVFKYEEVPIPKARQGEFLVEVHSAGLNPVDTKIRQGKFKFFKAHLPATIGRDIAGVVRGIGGKGGKSAFKIGDQVFGMLDYDRGAYAEFAVASAREIARRPKNVSERDAGAIGVAALTAWQCLFDHGLLKKGQRVLIHGAAGGVGHFAVQFAKYAGATVIATASTRDLKWVKGLGADEVIDFEEQKFEEHTGNIDLVLDLISGETQDRSWQVLKESGGMLVSTLSEPSKVQAKRHQAKGMRMVVSANAAQLKKIAALIATGRVNVSIEKAFPLEKVTAAHQYL
ncbi:MAG TPA: NADP-dependent oxidoreductase, partial [Opitutaceae bacterium]|nr:NADP-dependent oxidoreductase [Opitutaceae bacterium]